jgi:hypothetical protein
MRLKELPKGAPPGSGLENTHFYMHTVGATDPNDKAVFGADLNPEVRLPKGGFVFCHSLNGTPLLAAVQSQGTVDTAAF